MEVDSTVEENKVANNLLKYINKNEFMERNISSIDRIIQIYFNQNHDSSEERQVINFLFRYLDEKGENGSILFRHIKKSPNFEYTINRLYTQYRWKFDFDLVSSSLFLYSFDLIQINQKLKKILYFSIIFLPLFIIFFTSQHNCNKKIYAKNNEIKDLLQDKEKLENELNALKKKYENDLKIKEQLGNEITNVKEEMSTIKKHFENEITSVKEKQQEANELSSCKENLYELKVRKEQLENELSKCVENEQIYHDKLSALNETLQKQEVNITNLSNELSKCIENEQIYHDKLFALNETLQKQEVNITNLSNELSMCNESLEKFQKQGMNITTEELDDSVEKVQKKSKIKFVLILILDVSIGIAFFIFDNSLSQPDNFTMFLSFIFENALTFGFLFEYSSFVYYCFTIIFIFILGLLAFVSIDNKLLSKKPLLFYFVYIIITSTYKYTKLIPCETKSMSHYFLPFLFDVELFAIIVSRYNISNILFSIIILEITTFVYCSCIDLSSYLIAHIAFISTTIFYILAVFNNVGNEAVILSILSGIKYLFFIFMTHIKYYHAIIVVFLIIELLGMHLFYKKLPIFVSLLSNSLLLLNYNYNIFVFVFITIGTFMFTFLLYSDEFKRNQIEVFMLVTLLILMSYFISLAKFWSWYISPPLNK